MLTKLCSLVVALFVSAIFLDSARADGIVYSQPLNPDYNSNRIDGHDQAAADVFTVTNDITVSQLTFYGAWISATPNVIPPVSPTNLEGSIEILLTSGVPSCVNPPTCTFLNDPLAAQRLIQTFQPLSQLNGTLLGTQNITMLDGVNSGFTFPADIYSYTYTLPTPVDLTPGAYILGFGTFQVPGDDNYFLLLNGSDGDGMSLKVPAPIGATYIADNFDLAFKLNGTTNSSGGTTNVPEPSSVLLLGMGLGAIAICKLRR